MCVLAQFPVDLHAGAGETAREASRETAVLPGEVLIDPASAGVGSVVFSGSLLGASTGSYRRVFDTPPVSLWTFALPAPARD